MSSIGVYVTHAVVGNREPVVSDVPCIFSGLTVCLTIS